MHSNFIPHEVATINILIGLIDVIDFYLYISTERALTKVQKDDLKSLGNQIIVFGEIGQKYYDLTIELINE
jgi:hypothetical protein